MHQIDALLDGETENHVGEKIPYAVPISAYPTDSHIIIIVSPGSGELKDGRNDRWMKLARHFQEPVVAGESGPRRRVLPGKRP